MPIQDPKWLNKLCDPLMRNIVGKHNDAPDTDFKPDQLDMGIKIEQEHTDDLNLAKRIAKDHLKEIPDYYTRLEKMENDAKAGKSP